jgi:hypothetical protein
MATALFSALLLRRARVCGGAPKRRPGSEGLRAGESVNNISCPRALAGRGEAAHVGAVVLSPWDQRQPKSPPRLAGRERNESRIAPLSPISPFSQAPASSGKLWQALASSGSCGNAPPDGMRGSCALASSCASPPPAQRRSTCPPRPILGPRSGYPNVAAIR